MFTVVFERPLALRALRKRSAKIPAAKESDPD